jgi:hypothetical protein
VTVTTPSAPTTSPVIHFFIMPPQFFCNPEVQSLHSLLVAILVPKCPCLTG